MITCEEKNTVNPAVSYRVLTTTRDNLTKSLFFFTYVGAGYWRDTFGDVFTRNGISYRGLS